MAQRLALNREGLLCMSVERELLITQAVDTFSLSKSGYPNHGQKLSDYLTEPLVFTSEQLRELTDNFSEGNKIGPTQFGEVYRGHMQVATTTYNVTVKIWNEKASLLDNCEEDHLFVQEEVMFLNDPTVSSHPNLAHVIGYCCEDKVMGIVYDLKPMDSLHNLITRDDFDWLQRAKVALGFARLLKFLHNLEKPYIIRNIDAHHIMLDDDYNPILFDFALLSGGLVGELSFIKKLIWMSPGYIDPCMRLEMSTPDSDVFSYGIILLGLLSKRVFGLKKIGPGERVASVNKWAHEEYKENCSLVHESLEVESGYYDSDAPLITELGMRCIQHSAEDRPTMVELVDYLMNLQVFLSNAGVDFSENTSQ